jgi:hypothetical protein
MYQASIGGDDGNTLFSAGPPPIYYSEQGGDVGGQVFPKQADYDYIADQVAEGFGVKELTNRHQ